MKVLDKLKNRVKIDKNLFVFLIILTIVGIIAGSLFVTILNATDKATSSEYINNYITHVKEAKLDYGLALKTVLFDNFLNVSIIWLLGISLIGLPIIIIMYFSKSFILGFTIGSIIAALKYKGIIFALSYIFPHHIINIFIYTLLMIYSMSFSFKIFECIFKKKALDFKLIINKYLIILAICLIGVTITTLFEVYLTPIIVKTILPLL